MARIISEQSPLFLLKNAAKNRESRKWRSFSRVVYDGVPEKEKA